MCKNKPIKSDYRDILQRPEYGRGLYEKYDEKQKQEKQKETKEE